MSPRFGLRGRAPRSFPRVSGDEPLTHDMSVYYYSFSPRERG